MKKINKLAARKAYNTGKTIILFPCKANINSPWWNGGARIDNKDGISFVAVINAYEAYNCNNETGKYASFYITE